jgi:hypothetical protein
MENKLPITRLNKFFSQSDFDLQVSIGKEYLHGDLNMKLVLYRVDKEKTDIDAVYGEVGKDGVKFFPPVEFNALVKIEDPKNSSYKDGLIRYNEPGNLILSVYISHLQELGIDITYGDYIGYADSEEKLRFYNVTNDGKIVSDNKHKMFGYKPHYRTITCAPVQENEFRGV